MTDKNSPTAADDTASACMMPDTYCLLDTAADPWCDLITELLARLLHADIALISLVDENRHWFKSKKGTSLLEVARKDAFCTHTIEALRPMVVLDATKDARFVDNALVIGAPYIRFYAGAPLISAEGICLGALCVVGTTPRSEFSAHDLTTLEQLAALTMTRLENLRTAGYIDSLTTLPNRTRFVEDLNLMKQAPLPLQQSLTAVSVDVCHRDYFVDMIKALGWEHAEGFLLQAKHKLLDALNTTAVYRIGTTLFAYLHYADDAALHQQINDIHDKFNSPLEHKGIPYTMDVAVGILPMHDSVGTEDIVRHLFTAADLAREDGASQRVYEAAQGASQKHLFDILSSIPGAITAGNQLSLHFQPKVSLFDGSCIGVEALIRWRHPDFGDISPAKFIPLAEKTALIRRVTRWALRAGIAQCSAWLQKGISLPMAINVSARDFDSDELPDLLAELLRQYAIPPGLIEIEFTESAISKNPYTLRQKILDIKKLGVKIAIDDFGAGFSNLSYLKNIPADHMKIDQSFIRGLLANETDRMIVPSIIGLGHKLGFVIVAEGIECKETLELLQKLGCDHGQGYAIARPMPAEEMEAWHQQRRASCIA